MAAQHQLNLRGLTRRDIQHYVGDLSRANINATSIDRAISAIRGLYQFLFSERELSSDPTLDLTFLKKVRPLSRVLSIDEAQTLLAAPDDNTAVGLRDRPLLKILLPPASACR